MKIQNFFDAFLFFSFTNFPFAKYRQPRNNKLCIFAVGSDTFFIWKGREGKGRCMECTPFVASMSIHQSLPPSLFLYWEKEGFGEEEGTNRVVDIRGLLKGQGALLRCQSDPRSLQTKKVIFERGAPLLT